MAANATITITPIGNGYIVADAAASLYGESEWRTEEAIFYPSLDDLADDAGRFVKAAVEGAAERDRELKRELAEEEAAAVAGGIGNRAQMQRHVPGARSARRAGLVGY